MRRVLVTGATGRIGAFFVRSASARYDLRLTDLPGSDVQDLADHGELVEGDLTDLAFARAVCAGVDTVVHLAADPDPSATWDALLPANIVATYNTLAAAVGHRCRRVVYASSIHAVSGYAPDVQVKTTEPVNPGDLYGVTKCFGEALGRYVAEQEGVSVLAVRIGAALDVGAARPAENAGVLDAYVSDRDLQQLLERCIELPDDVAFRIVHGLSDNRFKRLDLSDTRSLTGYRPVDDAAALNEAVPAQLLDRPRIDASSPAQESGLRADLADG